MNSIFDGPFGYIASFILLAVFAASFTWKPKIKQIYDPEKEAGKAIIKLWKILNK